MNAKEDLYLLYRVFLTVILIFGYALIISNEMGNYHADEFGWRIEKREWKITSHDLEDALKWNPHQLHALTRLGENISEPSQSIKYLKRALIESPANGSAMSYLLYYYMVAGESELIDEAAHFVSLLSPTDEYANTLIARYWENKNNVDKALSAWSFLLSLNKSYYSIYFPRLSEEIDIAQLKVLANKNPKWWGDFFVYLCGKNDFSLTKLMTLYNIHKQLHTPSKKESTAYSNRLLQSGLHEAARLVWSDSSDENKLSDNRIYNGGFEEEMSEGVFSWKYHSDKNIRVSFEKKEGMDGNKALHISFKRKKRVNITHISQLLSLEPAMYKVQFRVKVGNLKNKKGVKWTIYCASDNKLLIGESESFKTRTKWKNSSFVLKVPSKSSCATQLFSLSSSGKYPHEKIYLGNIWFDNFHISLIKQ